MAFEAYLLDFNKKINHKSNSVFIYLVSSSKFTNNNYLLIEDNKTLLGSFNQMKHVVNKAMLMFNLIFPPHGS